MNIITYLQLTILPMLAPLGIIFVAKVLDNLFGTAKTVLTQRNKAFLAGLAQTISCLISNFITRNIVTAEGDIPLIIASVASGVGCLIAIWINDRISKDRLYMNYIMSDDEEAIKEMRDYLTAHHVKQIVLNSKNTDWEDAWALQVFCETKQQSRLVDKFLAESDTKYARRIQK